ncbi:MAG TPA: hypothetical protein VH599_14565 [Ktedonobacterales bacterium]|jgi:hypothetical protein
MRYRPLRSTRKAQTFTRRLRLSGSVIVLVMLALLTASSSAQAGGAAAFIGNAAGVNGNVNGQEILAASVTLPPDGAPQQASQATFSVENLLSSAALKASTALEGGTVRADASLEDIQVTIAGNTITADAGKAEATGTCVNGNADLKNSSTVTNLIVNGVSNPSSPVNLPGFGTLTKDFSFQEGTGASAGIQASALHIASTDNTQFLDFAFTSVHADCGLVPGAPTTGGGPIPPTGERPPWMLWGALLTTLALIGLVCTLVERKRWLR